MKKVLITGANKSIGFETARQLAKRNYYIYLGSRDEKTGEEAVEKLRKEGLPNVEALIIDVSQPASVATAREVLSAKTEVLDILINNAGISGGFPQPASTTDLKTIQEVFNTNFFGTINVTQAFLDLLKKSEQPVIVNVTSGLASLTLQKDPSWQFYKSKSAAYGPSKTALNAYTIALAYEMRDTPFKINAVDPGYTATDFNRHAGHNDVSTAASHIVKVATTDKSGPTGKYISWDNNPSTGDSPW